jgi:hypothetical protein
MRAGNLRFCCFLFVLLLSAYALVSRCVVTWLVTKLTLLRNIYIVRCINNIALLLCVGASPPSY